MTSEPRHTSTSLDFGPRSKIRRPEVKLLRLFTQLVFVLMLITYGLSTRESGSQEAGSKSGTSATTGTALPDPKNTPANLPAGMVLASSRQDAPAGSAPMDAPLDDEPAEVRPERTSVDDLPFLLESLVDLDRDLPPALYYHFLDKARQAPPERLISDARRDVTFSHLYKDPRNDPAKYRGQLLGISGSVRRALAFDVDKNAYGLTKRYELWVFTEDSGKFPWVVELTDLPPGFPLGTDIREQVDTAGYFLKLWSYRAQDGFRSAPILLGHGLTWRRTDQVRSRFERQFGRATFGFLAIFAVVILAALRRWRNEDRALRRHRSITKVFDRLDEIPADSSSEDGAFS